MLLTMQYLKLNNKEEEGKEKDIITQSDCQTDIIDGQKD